MSHNEYLTSGSSKNTHSITMADYVSVASWVIDSTSGNYSIIGFCQQIQWNTFKENPNIFACVGWNALT